MKHSSTYKMLTWALAVVALAAGAANVLAQDAGQTSIDSDETITVNTRLITVTARAADAKGRPLLLTPATLRVLADDTPQEIVFAEQSGAASVTLLVDKSASMSGEPGKHLLFAVESFIKAADVRNEYTLITFSDQVREHGQYRGDEEGRRQLLTTLAQQPYSGSTALYDACLKARKISASAPSRNKRALVVFTDGFDNASSARIGELGDGLDAIGGLAFVVVMSSTFATHHLYDYPLPDPKLEAHAARFRSVMDGDAFAVRSDKCIREAARSIASSLSGAVQLAFYPSPVAGATGTHSLRVETTVLGVNIRSRSRYAIE